jgi:hypothetical protein
MSPLVRRIPRRSYLPRWGRLRANSNAILIIQFAAASVNLLDSAAAERGLWRGERANAWSLILRSSYLRRNES